MKTKKVTVVAAFAAAVSATAFTGCTGLEYDNANAYSVGATEITGTVKNIEIEWLAGSVKLQTHEGNAVSVSETSSENLSDDKQLRYWLDGETLRIRYAKAKTWRNNELPEKALSINLPAAALRSIDVETVSASVEVTGVSTNSAEIETVSGNVHMSLVGDTDEVSVDSTSGEITISASVRDFELDSTSGNVSMYALNVPAEGGIDTTSGNIYLQLPEGAQFTADASALSGSISCAFEYTKQGNRFTCGTGGGSYELDSLSGNITIAKESA